VGRDGGQLQTASERFSRSTDLPEPDQGEFERSSDLRAIADAAHAVAMAEDRLREAAETARARGRSWRQIGLVLGISRQAARERFGQHSTAKGKASRARRVMRQETAVLDRLALNQSQKETAKHHPDGGKGERGQAKKVRRPH
jgi:hypothetical protein